MTVYASAPEGWEVQPLGRLAVLERGKFSARPRNDPKYFGGSTPFIQTGDVRNSRGLISAYSQTLNERGLKVSKLFPAGTLFITIAANIGDLGITEFASACPDSLVAVRARTGVSQTWLYFALSAEKATLESLATQNAQANLNLDKLNPFPLLVPTHAEQVEIAGVLSDAEELVRKLESLIVKARAIKQGQIQALMMGHSRLTGFAGEWSKCTYRDLVNIERGQSFNAGKAAAGSVPVIAAGRTPAAFTDRSNRACPVITISASGASAGYVAYHSRPIFASDCSTIAPDPRVDLAFLYYSLVLHQDQIFRAQAGGAQPHVHAKDIYPLEVVVPPTVDEQRAIAAVLLDADAKIALLQQRLTKARNIKHGLMQELLTGRTRLLTAEAAA